MKKILFSILLVVAMIQSSNAQLAHKGASFMQVGYGFPSAMQFVSSVFKFAINVDDAEASSEFKYSGFGPLHFRYEYMVGGRVGLGLSANAEFGKFKFTNTYLDYDDNYIKSTTNFNFSSINALARCNVHFLKRSDKLDIYYGFGVGYAHTRVKIEETLEGNILDPVEAQDVKDFNDYLNSIFKFMPVAVEEVFGLKAALGPNAGFYFEVGYSKALCQLGFYAKLGGGKGYYRDKWQWF